MRVAGLIIGVWTVIGLLTTQLSVLAMERTGTPVFPMTLLGGNLVSVWLWAAFTPAIVFMARRFPPSDSPWQRWTLAHLAGAVGFSVADVLLERAIWAVLPVQSAVSGDLVVLLFRRFFLNFLCYSTVVAISAVVGLAQRSRERDAAAARLAGQLASARLQALQTQLRPHFLFNTLSMIAEQVHVDPRAADAMIGRLSHLLRVSLTSEVRQEIRLSDEIRVLQSYLEIMSTRLVGRADSEVRVSPEVENAAIPALILQPLVENAYRHGLERMTRGGLLDIAARREGDSVVIEVADNGSGFDAERFREGVGLRIVRERLAELYGSAASIHLRPRVGGGTIAVMRLPFHEMSPDDAVVMFEPGVPAAV